MGRLSRLVAAATNRLYGVAERVEALPGPLPEVIGFLLALPVGTAVGLGLIWLVTR